MPIRPSSAAEIQPLIAALRGTDEVKREAAIARLAVIGPRAVDHLLTAFPAATTPLERAAILRALEALADPRALALAREVAGSGSADLAAAAIAVLRALLADHDASRDALDMLVAVTLDASRRASLRMAAFDAIRDLPADVLDPVRRQLASDPDVEVRAHAGATAAGSPQPWQDAVAGRLPASADALKGLVSADAPVARLTELQRLVDHIRARELREPDSVARSEWRAVRGLLHQALASRGSRLAIYDLRDSLLESGPLPVTFLAALEEIGDPSCIEPLAGAYDASSLGGDPWWREHVARAFRAIVRREGLTRRHLVVKRALSRWPAATTDLMGRS